MGDMCKDQLCEKQLLEKIERLRHQLYRSVKDDPAAFSNPTVQKLSQHLDELISCYTKKKVPR